MPAKIFGTKLPNETYIERPGAYGIAINEMGEVAIIRTSTGYFLPGGGIEDAETHKDCLTREFLEEAGLDVSIGDFICKGEKYFLSTTFYDYMHIIGYFYRADIVAKANCSVEDDHELVWLSLDECREKLFHDHQAWAVEQAALKWSYR